MNMEEKKPTAEGIISLLLFIVAVITGNEEVLITSGLFAIAGNLANRKED